VRRHAGAIVAAVSSTRTTGSVKRLVKVARLATPRYIAYRSTVQLAGKTPAGRRRTVRALLGRHGVPIIESARISAKDERERLLAHRPDIAIALNFDQLLTRRFLESLPHGVLNAHASRLPADRGISPALWAFARGDAVIWVTLYQLDSGLDTGPVYQQFPVDVRRDDSAYSIYCRVCDEAGARLAELVGEVVSGRSAAVPQTGERTTPHSWPDRRFADDLARSGRRLLRVRDLPHLLLGRE
jgi:methionyl-tRNA formyltransferase